MSPAPRVSGLAKQALALHAPCSARRAIRPSTRARASARASEPSSSATAPSTPATSGPSSIAPRTQAARAPPRPRREGPRAIASTRRHRPSSRSAYTDGAHIYHTYTHTRTDERDNGVVKDHLSAPASAPSPPTARPSSTRPRQPPRPPRIRARRVESGRLVTRRLLRHRERASRHPSPPPPPSPSPSRLDVLHRRRRFFRRDVVGGGSRRPSRTFVFRPVARRDRRRDRAPSSTASLSIATLSTASLSIATLSIATLSALPAAPYEGAPTPRPVPFPTSADSTSAATTSFA